MSSKDNDDDKESTNRRHTINLPTKNQEDESNSEDKKVERSASCDVILPTTDESASKQAHKIWEILTVPDGEEEEKLLSKIKKKTEDKLHKDLVKKGSHRDLTNIDDIGQIDPLNNCFNLNPNQNIIGSSDNEDIKNFKDVDKPLQEEPEKHKMESKTQNMREKLLKGRGKSPDNKKSK